MARTQFALVSMAPPGTRLTVRRVAASAEEAQTLGTSETENGMWLKLETDDSGTLSAITVRTDLPPTRAPGT